MVSCWMCSTLFTLRANPRNWPFSGPFLTGVPSAAHFASQNAIVCLQIAKIIAVRKFRIANVDRQATIRGMIFRQFSETGMDRANR